MNNRIFKTEEKVKVIARCKRLFERSLNDEKNLCDEDKAQLISTFNEMLDNNVANEETTLSSLLQEFNAFKKDYKTYLVNFGNPIDMEQILYYERTALLMCYEF